METHIAHASHRSHHVVTEAERISHTTLEVVHLLVLLLLSHCLLQRRKRKLTVFVDSIHAHWSGNVLGLGHLHVPSIWINFVVLFIFNLQMSRISESQKTIFSTSLVFKIFDGDLEVIIVVGCSSHISNRNLNKIPSLGLFELRFSRLIGL